MILPNLSSGYSKFDPETDVPPLQGKVIIVTGANSGIGFATVEELVRKGAKVYLGARRQEAGETAVAKIQAAVANVAFAGSVHWLPLDISTPRKARAGAQAFLKLETRLDVLIHNAGMLAEGYATISEGGISISTAMATNHLGPFVLTQELLPVLKATAAEPESDVRVILLSSDMHKQLISKPDFGSLAGWNLEGDSFWKGGIRYSMSKLANLLYARALQARLDADNVPITVMAIHPGLVYTEGNIRTLSKRPVIGSIILWIMRHLGLEAREGAFTSVFAAASPDVKANPEKYKGAYLIPFNRVSEGSKWSREEGLRKDLWRCSEEAMEICLREES